MYGTSRRSTGNSLSQWTYNKIHSFDIYAKPITLTFNKKPTFATVPGGLCSLMTVLLLLLITASELIQYF